MKLKGKYLVRPSKLEDGSPVLILTGVFYPNFDISSINENDEMWVSELEVMDGGLRFSGQEGFNSPEDFLEGKNKHPSQWKNKSKLDELKYKI